MKTKLKVAKTYNGAVDGINLPNYTGTDSSNFNGTMADSSCNAGNTAFKSSKEGWILADGSILMSYWTNIRDFVAFILDTNGIKGPNKWGYDIFLVHFSNYSSSDYKIRLDDFRCQPIEQGGYKTDNIILNN